MFQKFRTIHLLLWLFLLPLLAQPVLGADATSFDPTKVAVEAKSSGGVPVGTIISWPVATNPEDMDNWLECNGQSISPSVYPELFAVLGGQTPDLRGMFLRGYGSQAHTQNNGSTVGITTTTHSSGALGQVQGDASRNITGQFPSRVSSSYPVTGVFIQSGQYPDPDTGGSGRQNMWIRYESSRTVPTAPENRPVNTAVRFLVRARP